MSNEVGFDHRSRFVELGLLIAARRKLLGMSQQQLAKKAHISRSYLSSIEAPGISGGFSLEIFYRIADALEIRAGDLLNAQMPK